MGWVGLTGAKPIVVFKLGYVLFGSDHFAFFRRSPLRSGHIVVHSRELDMAALADRITVNPVQCGGRPCIRGMRIRVSDVLVLLANGLTREEVLRELPDLESEDVTACLRLASRRLDHPIVAA